MNILVQLSCMHFCIYVSLYHYFLIPFNAVSKCAISQLSGTELLVQMKVRKQKMFVQRARNEPRFVEMATPV